jgi:hypothetical protein
MTMTSNKAQKSAARQRMAQTGEPYSVARRAVGAGNLEPDPAQAPGAAGTEPGKLSPEEQYAQEARAAGVPAAQIGAQLAWFREQEAANEAWRSANEAGRPAEQEAADQTWQAANEAGQEAADRIWRAAEQARDLAERLEEAAERAEERADLAQEAAELAQEWADGQELDRAVERAGQLRAEAELARERAERAAEIADRAEQQADLAEEAPGMARDEHGGPWDDDEPWDDDGPREPEAGEPWGWHPEPEGMVMHRRPRPPRPPRPPHPPGPPRSW